MKVPYTNTKDHPVYIGQRLLQPGETREVEADLVPVEPAESADHVADPGKKVPPAKTPKPKKA